MPAPLPKETIQQIRTLVHSGKSKYQVAKDLGIGHSTVYRYTRDIPHSKQSKPLTKEMIQDIREEVLTGKSKYQIAKDMGLRFGVVYYHTQDLPNHIYREEGIQGQMLELLKEILNNGYIISTDKNTQRIRRLKRYLPMIQRSQMENHAVYYLSDKNKLALQSMIQLKKSKIISYQELANMSKVFDVKLSSKEKRSVLLRQKHS